MSDKIPHLREMVLDYCVQMGICVRCMARRPDPLKHMCSVCRAYKKKHKQGLDREVYLAKQKDYYNRRKMRQTKGE
jgi:hypothetical protein